jgi:hypothetical protein
VAELEALTHRMPAVAIEYLTQAYEGRLLPEDDIAAAAVHIQLASDDHPLLRARVRLLDIIRRVSPILLGLMTASRTRSSVCVGRRTDPSVVEQTTDLVG